MIKKFKYISYILLTTSLLMGCSTDNGSILLNKDNENISINEDNTENVTDAYNVEIEITVFNALGKVYSGNKGYEGLKEDDEVVNCNTYVEGEYKEIDFAKDLVSQLLIDESIIYDYLISTDENGNIVPLSESDRSRIEKDLYSFKVDQYGTYEDTPLNFNFMYAKFLGYDEEGVKLYIRGLVSGFGISYIVTVYEQGNNLVAKIV